MPAACYVRPFAQWRRVRRAVRAVAVSPFRRAPSRHHSYKTYQFLKKSETVTCSAQHVTGTPQAALKFRPPSRPPAFGCYELRERRLPVSTRLASHTVNHFQQWEHDRFRWSLWTVVFVLPPPMLVEAEANWSPVFCGRSYLRVLIGLDSSAASDPSAHYVACLWSPQGSRLTGDFMVRPARADTAREEGPAREEGHDSARRRGHRLHFDFAALLPLASDSVYLGLQLVREREAGSAAVVATGGVMLSMRDGLEAAAAGNDAAHATGCLLMRLNDASAAADQLVVPVSLRAEITSSPPSAFRAAPATVAPWGSYASVCGCPALSLALASSEDPLGRFSGWRRFC